MLCMGEQIEVILVDQNDQEIGAMEKLDAHRKGVLHRAFSIFVFNSKNELMLQKRAKGKYHSEGLWTNTCCSHPAPGEAIEVAARRRLIEEMGFDCNLQKSFHFVYKVDLDNELYEHELDHVLVGKYEEDPVLNQLEADDFRWITLDTLENEIGQNPENYTEWLKIILKQYKSQLIQSLS